MATRPFSLFPPEEQQQVAQVFSQVGLRPEDFEISDDVNGAAARRISVRRVSTDATSAYEAGPGSEWVEEFESDLECGLFGRVAA
ncbi:hypothetical protein [Cupriavidus sp. IDO]|uniref:hypothetical protein n=1 Tax=Cupriavidus sp. IDO TaxID=1539142 RepID=UPI0005797593|nr:hypothetical protein [Cupriavidus sp. IDO]KWR76416.1 hypothetical protein RM96_33205 [Cupriavidus sp. IDO]